MQGQAATHNWGQMSDADLVSAARYYFWLAESYPGLESRRLDEIVTEINRRGKPEILREAKRTLHKNK